jgi:hypothetical protein
MTDLYTKAILTIIAACLVVLVFSDRRVVPASPSAPMHVVVDAVGTYELRDAVPVEIRGR